MKRTIGLAFAFAMACAFTLALAGCGGSGTPTKTAAVGETVATDKVEFTLNSADFSIALTSSVPFGNDKTIDDNHYLQPKEYDPDVDAKNPYVASKGNVIVAIQFTANNLDRNSFELSTPSNSDTFITIKYKGKEYTTKDFVEKGWNHVPTDYRSVSGGTVTNVLLPTGESIFRGYFEIPVEPESLDDSFEVTFKLPTLDGKTEVVTYVK